MNKWDFSTDVATENIKLYAKWEVKTSINDEKHSGFKVYPNPTNSIIDIVYDQDSSNIIIDLTDINGKQIYHIKNPGNKYRLDLYGKPKGNYIVSIRSDRVFTSEKIILE